MTRASQSAPSRIAVSLGTITVVFANQLAAAGAVAICAVGALQPAPTCGEGVRQNTVYPVGEFLDADCGGGLILLCPINASEGDETPSAIAVIDCPSAGEIHSVQRHPISGLQSRGRVVDSGFLQTVFTNSLRRTGWKAARCGEQLVLSCISAGSLRLLVRNATDLYEESASFPGVLQLYDLCSNDSGIFALVALSDTGEVAVLWAPLSRPEESTRDIVVRWRHGKSATSACFVRGVDLGDSGAVVALASVRDNDLVLAIWHPETEVIARKEFSRPCGEGECAPTTLDARAWENDIVAVVGVPRVNSYAGTALVVEWSEGTPVQLAELHSCGLSIKGAASAESQIIGSGVSKESIEWSSQFGGVVRLLAGPESRLLVAVGGPESCVFGGVTVFDARTTERVWALLSDDQSVPTWGHHIGVALGESRSAGGLLVASCLADLSDGGSIVFDRVDAWDPLWKRKTVLDRDSVASVLRRK